MIGGSIAPRELVEYWVEHPSDFPLTTVIGMCDKNGYAIPAELLAELKEVDARRGSQAGGDVALVEPDIPAGYRKGASMDDPLVSEQGLRGGVLAEDGASGVFVQGGSDMDRGAAAASLLLAMQSRFLVNDVSFIDWADMIDRCRAAPLFGPESVAAALNPLKDVSILALHGVDTYARSRDGAEALEKVLRSRAANGGKTVLTSSIAWPALKRAVGEGSDLYKYLVACIADGDRKVNVVGLTGE